MEQLPEWNPSDPRASLVALAEFLHDQARRMMANDGTHLEILFILAEDGTMQPQPIAKPMNRKEVIQVLRKQLPGSNIYGLIHIAEAWGYIPKGRGDHTVKQLKLREMRVSDLKEDDKTELLVVSLLSRDGDSLAWLDEIIRGDDNKVRLARAGKLTKVRFPLGNVFPGGPQ
jgi:hypothetical protein